MDSNNNIKQVQEKVACYVKFVKSNIIGAVAIDGVCVFKKFCFITIILKCLVVKMA